MRNLIYSLRTKPIRKCDLNKWSRAELAQQCSSQTVRPISSSEFFVVSEFISCDDSSHRISGKTVNMQSSNINCKKKTI